MRVAILGVVVTAWLWISAQSRAQADDSSSAIIISNGLTQIAERLCTDDGSLFYFPDGLGWQVYDIGYWQPMWIEFSEYPSLQKLKSDAASSSNRCVLGTTLYGVQPLHVTITLDLLSGSLILSPGCSSEELANAAAPKNYQAGQWPISCRVVERLWEQWQTVQKDPDWQEWYGKDARPFATFHFQLADSNEKQIYEDNVLAEEIAWEQAEANRAKNGAPIMAENEGGEMMLMMQGDPCDTNVFQILDVQTDAQGWVTVGWCAASNVVYQIQAAPEMLTNTAWEAQALYVGEGYASWTDTNAPAFPHRFYRCRALPGDEDADGDGLSNMDEYLLGTDIDNPDTDGDGILDGDDPNPLDPSVGPPSSAGAIRLYNAFGIYTNTTQVYLQADARSTNTSVTVAAAEYFDTIVGTNGGGVAMSALDGSFNSTNEIVKATFTPSFSTNQHHVFWLHARDSNGVWGQFVKVVVNPNANDLLKKIRANYSQIANITYTMTVQDFVGGQVAQSRTVVFRQKGPYKMRWDDQTTGATTIINGNDIGVFDENGQLTPMVLVVGDDPSAASSQSSNFYWDIDRFKTQHDLGAPSALTNAPAVYEFTATPKVGVVTPYETIKPQVDFRNGTVTLIQYLAGGLTTFTLEQPSPQEIMPGIWLHSQQNWVTPVIADWNMRHNETPQMQTIQINGNIPDSLFEY
jgi:outer membrane lipoprotein-sorting protein